MLELKPKIAAADVYQDAVRNTGLANAAENPFLARLAPDWSKEARRNSAPAKHNVIQVDDPTSHAMPNGGRVWMFPRDNTHQSETIASAHRAESLLTQATDKYTDLINKEGYLFKCKTAGSADFLRARFRLMSLTTGIPWDTFLKESSRDYVEFGNQWWIKGRVEKKTGPVTVNGRHLKPAVFIPGVKPEMTVIGAYYRADPLSMHPVFDERSGQLKAWEQRVEGRKPKVFKLEQVIHFPYKPPAGKVLGVSMYEPVLDDIRALRMVEEYIIKLLFKHLFPLLHHEVPDLSGDGHATDEEIREAVSNYAGIAPDGMLVTPPGHKIKVVETKSGSIDGSPYLKHLLQRVLMGLGLSEAIMGLGSAAAGMSDMLTAQMHDRVKSFQQDIERLINLRVLTELLLEAGYDPIYNEDEIVELEFNEIEIESVIRQQNHDANMFGMGTITEDETRHGAGRNPLTDKDRKKKQIYTDKLPVILKQIEAEGEMQIHVADHAAGLQQKAADKAAKLADQTMDKTHAQKKDLIKHTAAVTKDKDAHKASLDATGKPPKSPLGTAALKSPKIAAKGVSLNIPAAGTVANKDNPANKYGSRGAPRSSKSPAAGHAARKTPKSAQ